MYKASSKAAWQGRTDAADGTLGLRWHQAVQMLDLSQELPVPEAGATGFAFLGFCCDEGVRRNQGRVGAAAGPAALRAAMAPFAWHLPAHVRLYDAGDVFCEGTRLEEAQELLGQKVAALLQLGLRPLVLGGGHETAYGHYLGLEKADRGKGLAILNFDAHFDLRSYAVQPSSGTPFLQIAYRMKMAGQTFTYNCVGLQEQGNTRALFATAEEWEVQYTFADEVQQLQPLKTALEAYLAKAGQVYTTIDLDVFAAAYAPGVSAVNALGLQPDKVLDLLKQVVRSGKLVSLDIAELNPTHDMAGQTAKLGAGLLYHVVKEWSKV